MILDQNNGAEPDLLPGQVFRGQTPVEISMSVEAGTTYEVLITVDQSFDPLQGLDGYWARIDGERQDSRTTVEIVDDFETIRFTYSAEEDGTFSVFPLVTSGFDPWDQLTYEVGYTEVPNAVLGTVASLSEYIATGYAADIGDTVDIWPDAPEEPVSVYVGFTGIEFGIQRSDVTETAWAALNAWSEATGLEFVEAFFPNDADITIDWSSDDTSYSQGWALNGALTRSEIYLAREDLVGATGPGSRSMYVMLHEIGHALGLGHSGNYNFDEPNQADRDFQIDSTALTLMSYVDYWDVVQSYTTDKVYPAMPQVADIDAFHRMYGFVEEHQSNTYYQLHSSGDAAFVAPNLPTLGAIPTDIVTHISQGPIPIFDRGGNDILDLSQLDGSVDVDLMALTTPFPELDKNGGAVLHPDARIETLILGDSREAYGDNSNNKIGIVGNVQMVDGRGGTDTLILAQDRASYDISATASGISIKLRDAKSEATLAVGFETFAFHDRQLNASSVLAEPTYGARLRSPDAIGTKYSDKLFTAGQSGNSILDDGNDIAMLLRNSFTVDAGRGSDRLVLGVWDDVIIGGRGQDIIQADGLSSLLGGNDVILGGPGNDLMSGGPGRDEFIFETDSGRDQIARFEILSSGASIIGPDFNPVDDTVRLLGFDGVTASSALAALEDGADGAVLDIANIEILFYGVDADDFSLSNFAVA